MTPGSDALMYAEDLPVGEAIDLGTHTVDAAEIIDFASQWDPQSIHVDADFASTAHFGGLIASGVHSLGIFQRLAVRGAYHRWNVIAGRSLREVRLTAPVRPGMTVRGTLLVKSVRNVHPDRALATLDGALLHDGQRVLELLCEAYVARRT